MVAHPPFIMFLEYQLIYMGTLSDSPNIPVYGKKIAAETAIRVVDYGNEMIEYCVSTPFGNCESILESKNRAEKKARNFIDDINQKVMSYRIF